MNKLSFRNLISIDQLSDADIKLIFKKAAEMRRQFQTSKITPRLKGKIAAALFYEPSSRTFASFLAAMQRLGGQVIAMPGMNFSSVAKGETFEDTIKTFSQLADILIVRHPVIGAAERAAAKSKVPIINAGDGAGEHPTQALLDAMTILNHFKNLREVKVGLVGDLKNGRTVHSLLKLLIKIGLKNFYLISPKALRMPAEIGRTGQNKIKIIETENLIKNINQLDILYMTRIQKERFKSQAQYQKYKGRYVIDENIMKKTRKDLILMHPLPRIDEIEPAVDKDKRSLYFREQIKNGLYVRMAILSLLLNSK
ncbi:MAG: aspartate carbamoyltransferase [Patescibacteria group bacterium]|jgi:aspartate carbamoyltransferase